jgi:hypothetical protein
LTVILPEMVPAHWWEHVLHNQTALRLKAALLFRPGVVVADVPYHLRRRRVPGAGVVRGPGKPVAHHAEDPAAQIPRRPRVIRHAGGATGQRR